MYHAPIIVSFLALNKPLAFWATAMPRNAQGILTAVLPLEIHHLVAMVLGAAWGLAMVHRLRCVDMVNLVGGLEHFLFSHILGIIIPIDSYFSEGFKPPTS